MATPFIQTELYCKITWSLYGETIPVEDDNEHLGNIISGDKEVEKNVDENISKTRGSLFSLLGPVFSPKCNVGPLLMCHIWKTYSCRVLRSGLSSLVLLPSHLIPLYKFHKKISAIISASLRSITYSRALSSPWRVSH